MRTGIAMYFHTNVQNSNFVDIESRTSHCDVKVIIKLRLGNVIITRSNNMRIISRQNFYVHC